MVDVDNVLKEAEEKLKSYQEHQEREAKFSLEANQRFKLNVEAFERYYPNIAKSIKQYQPREDYCIHVTKSGDGNFYPQGSDYALYNEDPKQQAQKQVEYYTENANYGFTDYFNSTGGYLLDDKRIHVKYLLKLQKVFNERSSKDNVRLKRLPENFPTGIIFGLGLGYHLTELLEKHTFDYLFICEPDYELFFASLYCIDWASLIKKIDDDNNCLFLHIGETFEQFQRSLRMVAEDLGVNTVINSFCYQHYPSEEVNKSIKSFFKDYYLLHQGMGFYNDAITGLAHTVSHINNGHNFFFRRPRASILSVTKSTPVFVVANGPSIDEAIEYIKKHQDNAIILAAGTALQTLLKVGITPDFHVLVERTKTTYDAQLDFLPKSAYSKLNLLAVDVMYPDVLDLYQWAGLGLKGPEASSAFLQTQTFDYYSETIQQLPASGPLVANTAISYATMMGFKEIYLFGVDNGYPKTGETHSKYSVYEDDELKETYKAEAKGTNVLKGNLGNDVDATALMVMSHASVEGIIRANMNFSQPSDYYNVGDGAFIEGAHPLRVSDLLDNFDEIENKESLIDEIKSELFNPLDKMKPDLEKLINFKEFHSLCDYLLEIGSRSYTTRQEAHELLKAQQRLVYAYKKSKNAHLYHLFKGSMLYFYCPLVTSLFFFEDEEVTLDFFKKGFDLWLEFIAEVKVDFPKNWQTKCDTSMYHK